MGQTTPETRNKLVKVKMLTWFGFKKSRSHLGKIWDRKKAAAFASCYRETYSLNNTSQIHVVIYAIDTKVLSWGTFWTFASEKCSSSIEYQNCSKLTDLSGSWIGKCDNCSEHHQWWERWIGCGWRKFEYALVLRCPFFETMSGTVNPSVKSYSMLSMLFLVLVLFLMQYLNMSFLLLLLWLLS